MSGITLPYNLQDGQKAYAARLMADLNTIVGKINSVSVSGLPDGDVETALQQLKLMLDEEYAADEKVVQSFAYDGTENALTLTLRNGALFQISMRPFFNDYSGVDGSSVQVTVDGDRKITAAVKEGVVTYAMLAAALKSVIDHKVTADATGNAAAIRFSDGKTMQEKLDGGDLKGADGVSVAIAGLFTMRVGDNGHLYVGVANGAAHPALSINASGHLIYTIG